MMIKPGMTELSKKADSRYTLVTMAAKRARMIGENSEMEMEDGIKPVSRAVEEIADGKVQYCRDTDGADSAYIHEGAVYSSSEPSSDLNLEALRYELEAEAERKRLEIEAQSTNE